MSAPEDFGIVAVLMGGVSSEREISLKSGRAVVRALEQEQCRVVALELDSNDETSLIQRLRAVHAEVVFIALHGSFGENGQLQDILDKHGFNYIGSGAQASRLAFDKAATQALMMKNGIQVPAHLIVRKGQKGIESVLRHVTYPAFVKPAEEGSSIGISRITSLEGMTAALELAWQYGDVALIEKAIIGRELTVGILNNRALPIVEIRPQSGYFDFKAKYEKGRTEYIVPALLDEKVAQRIQRTALDVFKILGCRYFARADFILERGGEHYFLEMNTIPGFTETSLLPKAAQYSGINFNQLCLKLIGMVHDEKKKVPSITRGI